MFELMNEDELKITNQIYFKDIKNLNKLNEKSNKFYDDRKEEDSYYKSNDENKAYSVSIF